MPEDRLTRLENEVKLLRAELNRFYNNADFSPDFFLALNKTGALFAKSSTDSVSVYTKNVNESGSDAYAVAKEYDGIWSVSGKIIGYYNDI